MYELHVVAGWHHALLLFFHIMLLVAWLGVDAGVFVASFFLRNPRYPIAERLMLGKLASILDMGPRASLLLMYPAGAWLAWSGGWGFKHTVGPFSPLMQLSLLTLLFLVWEVCVWVQFWGHRKIMAGEATEQLKKFLHHYRRWDIYARWVLAALLIIDGGLALGGRGYIEQTWLGWKVLLFGLVVLQGVGIRYVADAWPALIQDIVQHGSTARREAALNRALLRAYPFVLAIWGLILVISLIGIIK